MAPPTPEDIILLEMTIRGRVVVPQSKIAYQAQVQKTHNAGFHHHKPAMVCLHLCVLRHTFSLVLLIIKNLPHSSFSAVTMATCSKPSSL
jgi:hypothetical protein